MGMRKVTLSCGTKLTAKFVGVIEVTDAGPATLWVKNKNLEPVVAESDTQSASAFVLVLNQDSVQGVIDFLQAGLDEEASHD